jgi:hypothetical protein
MLKRFKHFQTELRHFGPPMVNFGEIAAKTKKKYLCSRAAIAAIAAKPFQSPQIALKSEFYFHGKDSECSQNS